MNALIDGVDLGLECDSVVKVRDEIFELDLGA